MAWLKERDRARRTVDSEIVRRKRTLCSAFFRCPAADPIVEDPDRLLGVEEGGQLLAATRGDLEDVKGPAGADAVRQGDTRTLLDGRTDYGTIVAS